jgi:hypothetical protein
MLMPWVDRNMAVAALRTMAWRAAAPAAYVAIEDDTGVGPVALLNAAVVRLDCDLVGYTAQDAFAGRYWLRQALACLEAQPEKGLLAFNDGKWFGQLAGFGLARLRWLDRIYGGGLFHGAYRHHFADTELSVVAMQQGAMAYDPHALLIEVDHGKDGRTVNVQDRETFHLRARHGFDGKVSEASLLSQFR